MYLTASLTLSAARETSEQYALTLLPFVRLLHANSSRPRASASGEGLFERKAMRLCGLSVEAVDLGKKYAVPGILDKPIPHRAEGAVRWKVDSRVL